MDFNKVTQEAVNSIIANKLPEMVQKRTEEAIEEIVRDMFRWDSDIKKQIKEKISESMNINLMNFDTIDYNALIAETINKQLIEQVNLEPIKEMISETIGFINQKSITLQEIADLVIEGAMNDNSDDYEGEITFLVMGSEYGYLNIYADFESDKDHYNCAFRFVIYRDNDGSFRRMGCFGITDYWNSDTKGLTPFKIANLSGVEQKIFRLYSAQVEVTNLTDSIDTSWCREDY
ncbi:hypothetical protein AV926_14135 [Myroides marinus]|uniref:Uncharacterized protein n=2 Tax=Myroides TaxID=76831 RepID=A0A161S0B2_9FLAO|nr:hypothetical protein [Myroides marinus]KZE77509.1 hypothetical protein AV926_14135 [Myroides marinus]